MNPFQYNVAAFARAKASADAWMEAPATVDAEERKKLLEDIRFHHTGLLLGSAVIKAANAVLANPTDEGATETLVHEIRRFHS